MASNRINVFVHWTKKVESIKSLSTSRHRVLCFG